MSLRRSHARRLSAAAAALVLATACPSDAPPGATIPPAGETPVRGGTLRLALAADVDALDPHLGALPSSWFFARAIHRGLYAFPAAPLPAEAQPVPDLASAMPVLSGDGRSVTIGLRSDARFADGAPVTAADAAASIQRLRGGSRGIASFLGPIGDVRVTPAGALRIRLTRPTPDLLWMLAHPQAAVVPAGTGSPGRVPPTSIVGAGPYRLRAYRPERRIVLERSDAAGDDPIRAAHLDGIDATIFATPNAAAAAVRDGRAHLLGEPGPPDLGLSYRGMREVRVPSTCVRYLFLDRAEPPFGDPDVRRAVMAAIDRTAFGTAHESLLAVGVLGAEPGARDADPDAARQALRRAGLPGGFRTEIVVADSPRDRREAAALRRMLGAVGIDVSVRTLDPALLYPRAYAGPAEAPMGIATWCADWPGLAGRNVFEALGDPASGVPTAVVRAMAGASIRRAVASASLRSGTRAEAAWRRVDRMVRAGDLVTGLAQPIVWSLLSVQVGGFVGGPMFPRGDPAVLWLDPAAPAGG